MRMGDSGPSGLSFLSRIQLQSVSGTRQSEVYCANSRQPKAPSLSQNQVVEQMDQSPTTVREQKRVQMLVDEAESILHSLNRNLRNQRYQDR